jgi:voltage-gated potassium channel
VTRRVLIAAGLLASVVAGGTVGYMLIERWRLLDSLYMTVITVATVGFREVRPLSATGQVFTIGLIAAGVGGIAYSIGIIAEFVVEGQFRSIVEGRRMAKRISELENHYVVVGMGRVGSVVCSALRAEGVEFVVVDRCEGCAEVADEHGWLLLHGDATDEETLVAAGVSRARGLVTALDTDADNLFVALTARGLNPDLYIVARSSSVASEGKILRSGADRVLTPNVIGGRRMAAMLLDPLVSDYLDLVAHSGDLEFRLESLEVTSASQFAGLSIGEGRVHDRTGAFILAIARGEQLDTSPKAEAVLAVGDRLVALGTRTQLQALQELL